MSGLVGYGNDPVKIVSGVDSPNAREWTFDSDGNLQLPPDGDIVNSNGISLLGAESGTRKTSSEVTLNTPSLIWTSSQSTVRFAKLLIQAECDVVNDVSGTHTQSCEVIIAARSLGEPSISIYGIVYTSDAPLVTFTVQRNPVTNNIEVICSNTGIVDSNPLIRIYSIEQVTRT